LNAKAIAGIVLIVAGALALAYQGFTYTTRDETVDLGPLQITTERQREIPLPPIVGAIALAGGIGLLVWGTKKS
jgi:hypothetical protein